MLKSEFDALLGRTSSAGDYELIEKIYNYHPLNFSKEAVANLYKEFGIIIFEDMEDRSNEAMALEEQINKARSELRQLEEDMKHLGERKGKQL